MQTETQVHNIGIVNQMTPAQKDSLLLAIADTLGDTKEWSDGLEDISCQLTAKGFKIAVSKDFG